MGRADVTRLLAVAAIVLAFFPATGFGEDAETAPAILGPMPEFACYNCHAWREAVLAPRALGEPHDSLSLEHGGARFWCLECHNALDMDTLLGRADKDNVGFERAELRCAKCHPGQVREWRFGVHGKRVGGWRGPLTVLRCAACHNPHSPAFTGGKALPAPPKVRPGVEETTENGDEQD